MNPYYVANEKVNLGFYPNYSFEIGDIDGDGRMEFLALDKSGSPLRAFNLEGDMLFERTLENTGTWGTALICVADVNGDGKAEIIVPSGENIVAFDGKGNRIRERKIADNKVKDDFGICIPLIGAARLTSPDKLSVVAAIAGGRVVALDGDFNEIWRVEPLRHDFGHEIHFADVDGDGLDEIAFCSVHHINMGISWDRANETNSGVLVLLDHDGTVMLRKKVDDLEMDSHFDDVAMADFMGTGKCQILVEKGYLLDLYGNLLWSVGGQFDHGQWIAHTPDPNGKGKLIFISELWGTNKKSMLLTGQGEKIKDIGDLPWPVFDESQHISVYPSRCHTVRWDPKTEPEIFLSQQCFVSGDYYTAPKTVHFPLKALFMDLRGNLVGEMPFGDAMIEGYYYNGETHSRACDVDGDGREEIVFVKEDRHVMIIKKHV